MSTCQTLDLDKGLGTKKIHCMASTKPIGNSNEHNSSNSTITGTVLIILNHIRLQYTEDERQ